MARIIIDVTDNAVDHRIDGSCAIAKLRSGETFAHACDNFVTEMAKKTGYHKIMMRQKPFTGKDFIELSEIFLDNHLS